jgi:hypothetical protein
MPKQPNVTPNEYGHFVRNPGFDMTKHSLQEIRITENNAKDNCIILKNGSDTTEYRSFILFKNSATETICDVTFYKSSTTGRYIPRPTFKKRDIRTGLNKSSINIEFSKGEQATSFWNLISFLNSFKELVDCGDFKNESATITLDSVNEWIAVPKNRKSHIESLLEENYGEDIWNELVKSNPNLATKLANIKILNDRKFVLEEFKASIENSTKNENYWQVFFTKNDWIFGYGLQYKFLVTETDQPNYGGADYKGKRAQKGDFLTYTHSSNAKFTLLVEIKKPHTLLLASKYNTTDAIKYRNGAWLLGSEVLGGVQQLQINIKTWQVTSDYPQNSNLRDEHIYTVQPKGILVIGNTKQLKQPEQLVSFELFRRNLMNLEIITFDELYERASFIADTSTIKDDEAVKYDDGTPF